MRVRSALPGGAIGVGEFSSFFAEGEIVWLQFAFGFHATLCVVLGPQRHHRAHQQGAVHGGRRHRRGGRREALHPPDEPAGRRGSGEGHQDPADGAAANHER